ncbi:hypothetical protein GALMADRAFT_284545 [Galerina marginata CBS 339.88]|uniref:Uncharacterized protein n=1 Tax=Galerina marginata (strain CBS 339.88) TaxID=685588 RepID=A0A067TNG5_GALM3|nr:hypothetical protein GALMADRAFT_284545 [Galerina marginata CBS 339.88]
MTRKRNSCLFRHISVIVDAQLQPPSPMSSPTSTHDEFNHHLAIKLSRALNTLNPNDLLAQRVIDIAKTNTTDGFILAAKTFGSNRCCPSSRRRHHRV